jgi:ADP-ribosylglycohydrolase
MTKRNDRLWGCLLGLACGDAVDTTMEFKARETVNLPFVGWSRALLRNLLFLIVVLSHGLLRLVPCRFRRMLVSDL